MSNRARILWLGLIGAFSWALVAMLAPARPAPGSAAAPTLGVAYARPVERVQTHELAVGETLSGVLANASITGAEQADLLLALREHENPRLLPTGTEVTVHTWASDGTPRAVDVRLNADSTVVLRRGAAGWDGHVIVTPTHLDTVYVAGQIDEGKTLFESIVEDETLDLPVRERYQLVYDLAEIYAYKLDFAHEIQPGDSYRVVYEREARPDGTARRRRILVSEIDNQGKSYLAFWYKGKNGDGAYFDRAGQAMRQGFRRYPVDFVRITSGFSRHRFHPILGIYRAHLGTDFGAAYGTPVKATADGRVKFDGRSGGYGNLIILAHAAGYTTRYGHLSRFARGLHPGEHVKQGQVIGYVGQTGLATGPHLHYEIRLNGRPLNPRTAHLPPAGGVPAAQKTAYAEMVQSRLGLLSEVTQRVAARTTGGDHGQTPTTGQGR